MPLLKLLRLLVGVFSTTLTVGLVALIGVYFYYSPQLPSIDELQAAEFKIPLRLYSADNQLIGEFGEERRTPIAYKQLPDLLVKAVLAAEDDRFFQHPGVDWQGISRALLRLLQTGHKDQGGSTITMQVARNFFLSTEKTYERKVKEILLALKIEQQLSKETILELYLNKIYLGQRAYGVEAAAQSYFAKSVGALTLSELAIIAGLPKAPSTINPITAPEKARDRRNYVLGRMLKLNHISQEQYQAAIDTPIATSSHAATEITLDAPYVAEMARLTVLERYGEETYRRGLRVYTTVDGRLQTTAQASVRNGLNAYDQRHGYRNPPVRGLDVTPPPSIDSGKPYRAWRKEMNRLLEKHPIIASYRPAIVIASQAHHADIYLTGIGIITLPEENYAWAPSNKKVQLKMGDLIYVEKLGDQWQLVQIPDVQGALVAVDPFNGRLLAISGGFDFRQSSFNRAVQAKRQAGSSFKPFLYSAGIEKKFTPASIIQDAPITIGSDPKTAWSPKNYGGNYYGPMRLREALLHSRNLVSVRVLQDIGVDYAINYVQRFGFRASEIPHELSISLGSLSLTPMDLARAYAVFANGGYLIEPYLIERIEDSNGILLYQHTPLLACDDCATPKIGPVSDGETLPPFNNNDDIPKRPWDNVYKAMGGPEFIPQKPRYAPRVLDAEVAYIMNNMMQDVVRRGTGTRALALGRQDLAAKTGTTNDSHDAWFCGFNRAVSAVAWVGYDQPRSLGDREVGGVTAGPIWVDFMREATKDVPDEPLPQPVGVVTARISPTTGLRVNGEYPGAIFEVFLQRNIPPVGQNPPPSTESEPSLNTDDNPELINDLF